MLEAQVQAAKAILEAAGLTRLDQETAVFQLDHCFQQITQAAAGAALPAAARFVVEMAHRRIDDTTPLDQTLADSEIERAREFVETSLALLNNVLPPLFQQGLGGWAQVAPMEDPSGGAYR